MAECGDFCISGTMLQRMMWILLFMQYRQNENTCRDFTIINNMAFYWKAADTGKKIVAAVTPGRGMSVENSCYRRANDGGIDFCNFLSPTTR